MRPQLLLLTCLFTASVATSQEFLNSISFGGPALDDVYDSHIDASEDVYVVGHYGGTLTFGDQSITQSGGNVDAFLGKFDDEGNPLQVLSFGGLADEAAFAVETDSDGDVIVIGYFQGAGPLAFDADPGPGEVFLSQPAPFLSRDAFILKLTSNGELIWAKQVSNPFAAAQEDAYALTIDSDDNIYVGGRFQLADFDPGPGEELIFANGDASSFDGFLLKLNSEGDYQWVQTFSGDGDASVEAIDIDENDDLFLTGYFENEIDLDPSAGSEVVSSNGARDIFTVKLNANGEYSWGQSIGGADLDFPNEINEIDGDIYLTGGFSMTVDLDPSAGTAEVVSNGLVDAFIAKYDGSGTYQFSYALGSSSSSNLDEMDEVRTTSGGTLSVSGNFIGTVDFDMGAGTAESTAAGGTDFFLLELSANGEYIQHITLGGDGNERRAHHHLDASDDVTFISGRYEQTIDTDPFDGMSLVTSAGSSDMFLSRFNYTTADCPTDLNNDGFINVNDFLVLNSAYGSSCDDCAADINGDGVVDIQDFLTFNSTFNQACP